MILCTFSGLKITGIPVLCLTLTQILRNLLTWIGRFHLRCSHCQTEEWRSAAPTAQKSKHRLLDLVHRIPAPELRLWRSWTRRRNQQGPRRQRVFRTPSRPLKSSRFSRSQSRTRRMTRSQSRTRRVTRSRPRRNRKSCRTRSPRRSCSRRRTGRRGSPGSCRCRPRLGRCWGGGRCSPDGPLSRRWPKMRLPTENNKFCVGILRFVRLWRIQQNCFTS